MSASSWRTMLGALALMLTACAGARHRRVQGPPPEYERPDDPGANDTKDGGPFDAAPRSRAAERGAEDGAAFVLTSPDGQR